MKNKFFLSTAYIAICLGMVIMPHGFARAQEAGSIVYYPVTEEEYRQNEHAWRVFLEYQLHREQCQNYQQPPAGFIVKNCELQRVEEIAPAAGEVSQVIPPAAIEPQAGTPDSYTIYFDFDKSNIRSSETSAMTNVTNAIQQSHPATIIISGHTDRAGSERYNQGLSERRAMTVMRALAEKGVSTGSMEQRAYGETQPAVPTQDGVAEQGNRRVVIDFQH